MANIKPYKAKTPPVANLRVWANGEFREVSISIDSLIEVLKNIGVPIEAGAPNSGGAGYRMLRIPN